MVGAGGLEAALARGQLHAAVARLGAQLLALLAAGVDVLHQRPDALLAVLCVFLRRLLMLLDGGKGALDVVQLRFQALALDVNALDARGVGGLLVLHGLQLRLGAGAGDLLPVQFVVQFAAFLFQARALCLLPHQFVAGGDRLVVQLAEPLAQFLDLAAAGKADSSPGTARCRRSSSRRSA